MYKTRLKKWGASRYRKKVRQQPLHGTSQTSAQEDLPLSPFEAQPDVTSPDLHNGFGNGGSGHVQMLEQIQTPECSPWFLLPVNVRSATTNPK